MKGKNIGIFLVLLVGILSLISLVMAVTKDYVSVDVINTSTGSSSQGGGFVVYSNSGIVTNGTQLNFGPASLSTLNLSGVININMSLIANGSHGGYVNVTFGWILSKSNASTMLNFTAQNYTFNQTAWNWSFNTNSLAEGIYNISIRVFNVTTDGTLSNDTAVNFSRGIDIGVDRTAPLVNLWFNGTNGSNLSSSLVQILVFNATVNDTTLSTQEVRFELLNGNATGMNLTAFHAPAGVWSVNVTTSQMSDGIYTIILFSNDTLNNINRTIANLSFTLDRTAPNVTTIQVGNYSSSINLSAGLSSVTGNFVLNISITINDTTTVQSVRINVTNSSGTVNTTGLTYLFTGIHNVTYPFNWVANGTLEPRIAEGNTFSTNNITKAAINVSALAEGWYNITVLVNDSVNNLNTSTFVLVIDRTAPTVSVVCTTNPTVGSIVTCTCTASDATSQLTSGYGFQGSVLTESTTASTVGTFSSSKCSATDYAGNSNSATGSWTTVASSSSNSGSGGGSGSSSGVSTGVQSQFQKKVWASINAGETASVPVKNDGLAVTEVSFAVDKTTYGAWLQVDKEDTLPSNIKPVETKVYKNLKITESNIAKALKGTATITFQVEKSWLSTNNINSNDVVMNRYVDGKWVELTTTKGEDDGTFVHYTAQTPGFSYFSISQKSGAPTVETVKKATAAPITAEPATPQVEAQPTEEAKVQPTAAEVKTKRALWPWIVAVLVVIALAWFFLRPRK